MIFGVSLGLILFHSAISVARMNQADIRQAIGELRALLSVLNSSHDPKLKAATEAALLKLIDQLVA